MQVHSPDLFCFLFLNVKEKELKLPMAFKKNVENIIFSGYFHSKKIIAKVILLFTCSYFSKDNPLMARKGGEFKGLRCKGSGPGGIVLC